MSEYYANWKEDAKAAYAEAEILIRQIPFKPDFNEAKKGDENVQTMLVVFSMMSGFLHKNMCEGYLASDTVQLAKNSDAFIDQFISKYAKDMSGRDFCHAALLGQIHIDINDGKSEGVVAKTSEFKETLKPLMSAFGDGGGILDAVFEGYESAVNQWALRLKAGLDALRSGASLEKAIAVTKNPTDRNDEEFRIQYTLVEDAVPKRDLN